MFCHENKLYAHSRASRRRPGPSSYLSSACFAGIGSHPRVHTLYVHNNLLTSFEGFEPQPSLKLLHASDNMIESLRGLVAIPSLERIDLKGNPLASLRHYRVMVIAAVGRNVRVIDGELVRKTEVECAMFLGNVVADALREGWILDTVPDPEADYDFTIEQFLHARKYGPPGMCSHFKMCAFILGDIESADLQVCVRLKIQYSQMCAYTFDSFKTLMHNKMRNKTSTSMCF